MPDADDGQRGLPMLPVPEHERERVLDTLVAAFAEDPVERWLYPADEEYISHFREFLAAFGGNAFGARAVWRLGDFDAVAMWMPPGVEPDGDAIEALLTTTVASAKQSDTFAVLEQMDAAHPKYPHWYLPWLGVLPKDRGKGLGSRILAQCLEIVDATHLPAYLETPNPRTLPLYERHGFEPIGGAQSGECPPIAFMARPAR
jgi:GNAT superfamily N-acetyltransferase